MPRVTLSDEARSAMADAIRILIDAGSEPGTISFYGGSQPKTKYEEPEPRALLAMLHLSKPCAGPAIKGELIFGPIEEASAIATEKATWARIMSGDGTVIYDVDVGTHGASINMSSVDFEKGGPVKLMAFNFTIPARGE